LIAEGAHMRLDPFALKPVENVLGYWNDVPNPLQSVWGSYLTVPPRGTSSLHSMLPAFQPGTFFNTATYNSGPIVANVGFTYRF
jgi:hypothetical protein